MVIGDRLKELRESKELSQGDIEKRTGLLRCYISRVENGHTVPAVATLEKMARALEVPMYSSFMKAKRQCQFARRNVPRAVRSGEAKAAKPTTCPSCADYLRRWGLASKNFCSTWPKKSRSGANLTASQRGVLVYVITFKKKTKIKGASAVKLLRPL
jgi:transcriptional regulator with XRE-family HTH domain